MAQFSHGVAARDIATSAFLATPAETAFPFAVGSAPGGRNLEKLTICNTFGEFLAAFGIAPSAEAEADYGLLLFAKVFFGSYGVGPACFVNVLDPDLAGHQTNVPIATAGNLFADGTLALGHAGVTTLQVSDDAVPTTVYVLDTDYSFDASTGIITRIPAGAIAALQELFASYDYADPSKVAAVDVIGGEAAGIRTGLELLEEVLPRFNKVATLLIAPGFTDDATVAAALVGKQRYFVSGGIGLFRAMVLLDVPVSETTPADAVTWKATYASDRTLVCWPRWSVGTVPGVEHPMSYHLAGVMARTDANAGGLPHVSPSNQTLAPGAPTIAAAEKFLTKGEVDLLNSNGIITSFRMGARGFVIWGNRTAAHPSSVDPVEVWIPTRRMFDFVSHTLILSAWGLVDQPGNTSQINRVVTTVGQMLNGWEQAGALLAGHSIQFLEGDNPVPDLLAGIFRFRVRLTPPIPAETIEFLLEFDAAALSSLFA